MHRCICSIVYARLISQKLGRIAKGNIHHYRNDSYTLLICTPPFSAKDTNFRILIIHTCQNEIIILLFVYQKRKHGDMAFLTSKSVSKHVLFALGVDPTAMQDAVKAGVPTSQSLASCTLCSVVRD